jgi:uncharacterized protein
MKPLFFGAAERRLYGVYHPPNKGGGHAVLLCYPGIQEYNAAHWAFRRLATMLARDGHHVLRFDYFGTGDSDGDAATGTPARWVEDVQEAAQELKDLSGCREISLIGMRIGAAIAAIASSHGLHARRLILWEPVINGRSYVRELELWDERRNLILLHAARTRGRKDELLGHVFSSSVRESTEALDLLGQATPRTDKAIILAGNEALEHRALRSLFELSGVRTDLRMVTEPATNAHPEARERALPSNAVLVEMVQELRELSAA